MRYDSLRRVYGVSASRIRSDKNGPAEAGHYVPQSAWSAFATRTYS